MPVKEHSKDEGEKNILLDSFYSMSRIKNNEF